MSDDVSYSDLVSGKKLDVELWHRLFNRFVDERPRVSVVIRSGVSDLSACLKKRISFHQQRMPSFFVTLAVVIVVKRD